jgi:hypothetical protein
VPRYARLPCAFILRYTYRILNRSPCEDDIGRTAHKPTATSTSPQLEAQCQAGKIWSPIRQKWLNEAPEEKVRQEYLCILANEYGFGLDQIAEEESVTERGSGQARADFITWRRRGTRRLTAIR